MSTIIPKQYAFCVTEKVCHATLQMAFFRAQYFSLEIRTEEISVLEAMARSVAIKQLFSDESLFNGN